MYRLPLLFALAAVLQAQDIGDLFNKPPADVDRALRARITEFYQSEVKGDFRHAETLVAEDTKDYFYNGLKPKYLSFEIQKVKYNDDFTKANTVILIERILDFPGFPSQPVKVPVPSAWKLENGKWCWYVSEEARNASPFGPMKPGPPVPGGGPDGGKMPIPATAADFFSNVKPDKQSVEMKPGSVEHVTISNGTTGMVAFDVQSSSAGLRPWLDHSEVKPGEKAVLAITALENARSGTVNLRIKPYGPVIAIHVTVK
jgi:hypothetical protein